MKKLFFLFLFLFSFNAYANDEILDLVYVWDGDTIKVIRENKKISVRFIDIDCFETSNIPHAQKQIDLYDLSIDEVIKRGYKSKEILKDLLKNESKVRVKWERKDRYRRILGTVYRLDGVNLNEYMLKSGGCPKYIPTTAKR